MIAILFVSSSVFAAEIREFDLKTVVRLGREMNRVSQRADKGATDAVRKQAQRTAIAALKGRLFKIGYDFLVVDDPDGSGFLVYAMPTKPGQIVLGGNFRVTVSADGNKAERVDAMARTLLPAPKPPKGMEGQKPLTISMSQIVSNRPLETCVYTSLHDTVIVSVGMVNDNAKVWVFVGDKIYEMTPELLRSLGIDDSKKK
ncbi:MAG TPA: hypothetical protein VK581_04905 [Chthoniobacterales bacterium]|nr:hypothetical protein [Chthoniobacterales bacterium]